MWIELSALNSAFYACDCLPALSTLPDGDIINVNCMNCTAIARDVVIFSSFLISLFFSFSLIYLSLAPRSSSHLLQRRPRFYIFFLPAPPLSHFLSLHDAPFPLRAERMRLHLHLNLAVDLAVVQGHHSCRGKGRL